MHIEQALAGVAVEDRCACKRRSASSMCTIH